MGYKVIKKEECNYETNDLKLLKYAILSENEKIYLQLKVKNISDDIINGFTVVYTVDDEKRKYKVDYKSNPGDEFLEKDLIEIDGYDFEFIAFKEIDKSYNDEDPEDIEDYEDDEDVDDDDFGFSDKKKKNNNVDIIPWIIWGVGFIVTIIYIIAWIISMFA